MYDAFVMRPVLVAGNWVNENDEIKLKKKLFSNG